MGSGVSVDPAIAVAAARGARTWTIVGSFLLPSTNSSKSSDAFLSLSMFSKICSGGRGESQLEFRGWRRAAATTHLRDAL